MHTILYGHSIGIYTCMCVCMYIIITTTTTIIITTTTTTTTYWVRQEGLVNGLPGHPGTQVNAYLQVVQENKGEERERMKSEREGDLLMVI